MSGPQRSDLWGVRVSLEHYDPAWADSEFSPSRAEWNARPHRGIVLMSAHDPKADPRPDEETYPAYMWCAGFLARAVIDFFECQFSPAEQHGRHGCHESGMWCGDVWGTLDDPAACVREQAPPMVEVQVPREEAKDWLAKMERTLAAMLAGDRAPLRPQPDHPGATLAEPHASATQERTR